MSFPFQPDPSILWFGGHLQEVIQFGALSHVLSPSNESRRWEARGKTKFSHYLLTPQYFILPLPLSGQEAVAEERSPSNAVARVGSEAGSRHRQRG